MAEQPRSRLPVRDFKGLVTNEDSHDLAPGEMQVQRNLQIFSKGRASVRKGMAPVTFDNPASPTTAQVQSLTYFRIPGADLLVYQDSLGNVKAGRNPGTPGIVSGNYTMITTPSQNADYVQWIVDGVQRFLQSTFTTVPPYRLPTDTSTFSNGTHLIQPVAYRGPYRDIALSSISGYCMDVDFSDVSTLFTTSGGSTHVANDGDLIGKATDKSATVNAFTSGTGPTWKANQFNGLGAASFTGSNSQILTSSSIFNNSTGDVFVVLSIPAVSELFFCSAATGSSNNALGFEIQSGLMEISGNFNGTTRTPTGNSVPHNSIPLLLNFRCGNSAYDFYYNGTEAGATGAGDKWFADLVGAANITIGGITYGGGTSVASCIIGQIVVFNTYLSDADRLKVETILAEKWGTPLPGTGLVSFGAVSGVPRNYANTIPYTVETETPYTIVVSNPDGIVMPTIHHHFDHIKIFHYKTTGPLDANEQAKFISSVDLAMISDPTMPAILRAAGATAPIVVYRVVSQLVWYEILEWLNYADANNVSRADAFFHLNQATALSSSPIFFTQFGAQGFPVRWWWDAQQFVYATGVFTLQHTGVLQGTKGSGSLTDAPWINGSQSTTLSSTANDYLAFGYPELFDEIDIDLTTGASGGWTGVIEYPIEVDANGVAVEPWATLTTISDGTAGFTVTGAKTIHWNPYGQTLPWVKAYLMPGGSGMMSTANSNAPTGMQGYYLRFRTVTGGGVAPVASYIRASDYTSQGDSVSGTVPVWNIGDVPGAGYDTDGNGYLDDTEMAALTGDGHTSCRFYYQSRLPTNFGTNTIWTNFANANLRNWVSGFLLRALASAPQYDGFFLDDSNASSFGTHIVEDTSQYEQSQGAALGQILRDLPIGPSGTKILIPNMSGNGANQPMQSQLPIAWYEKMLKDSDNWMNFETSAAAITAAAGYFSPPPLQIIDSFFTEGSPSVSPTDRARLQLLAEYYMVSRPETYFEPFGDNFLENGTNTSDNWLPYRWIEAIAVDIGQPIVSLSQPGGLYTVFANNGTGTDPDSGLKTYKVYSRYFDNALVLFKPLSVTSDGLTNGLLTGTPTVHTLGGTFYPVDASGNISASGVTSISLNNGQGAILMRSPN